MKFVTVSNNRFVFPMRLQATWLATKHESHVACNLMGNTNLLLETVTNFIPLSPYKPSGTYVLCIGNGKLDCVFLEKRKIGNKDSIDLKKTDIGKAMKYLLEDYQLNCGYCGLDCYDTFKLQESSKDFDANVKRLELAGIWDEIVEFLKRYELPDAFECQNDWIDLGTRGRPKRYKFTQRWFENAKRMPTKSSWESCFWAKVEELHIKTSNAGGFAQVKVKEEVLKLEEQVQIWIKGRELGKDVFSGKSTFMKWWNTLPKEHKSKSCIKNSEYAKKKLLAPIFRFSSSPTTRRHNLAFHSQYRGGIKTVWVMTTKNSPQEICLVRYRQLLDCMRPNQVASHKKMLTQYPVGSPMYKHILAVLKYVECLHRITAKLPLEETDGANPHATEDTERPSTSSNRASHSHGQHGAPHQVVSRSDPPPPPHASPMPEFPPPPHASPATEFPPRPHASPFPDIPPRTAYAVPDLEIPLPTAHASSHPEIPSHTPRTFFDPAHLSFTPPCFDLDYDFSQPPPIMHTQSPSYSIGHIDHVPPHSHSMSFMPTPGLHIDPMTTGLTHTSFATPSSPAVVGSSVVGSQANMLDVPVETDHLHKVDLNTQQKHLLVGQVVTKQDTRLAPRYQKRAAKLIQEYTAAANEVAQETLSLTTTVRIYGTERKELGRQ
ncbi:protein eds1b [Quercus suber]|uniref:Protein eds1b n=1 Tax=Quercus suber TaxID=58331 RepID=A0AAW0LSS6_QUESU